MTGSLIFHPPPLIRSSRHDEPLRRLPDYRTTTLRLRPIVRAPSGVFRRAWSVARVSVGRVPVGRIPSLVFRGDFSVGCIPSCVSSSTMFWSVVFRHTCIRPSVVPCRVVFRRALLVCPNRNQTKHWVRFPTLRSLYRWAGSTSSARSISGEDRPRARSWF